MSRQQLTLLQRAVIQRLRLTGHPAIAYEAHACWTIGECVDQAIAADIDNIELRSDFIKANAQVPPE